MKSADGIIRGDEYQAHFSVFQRFIQDELVSISTDRYIFNGEPDDGHCGSLELRFVNNNSLLLSLATDGVSVLAELDLLKLLPTFTLECGSRCEWRQDELTSRSPLSNLIGRRLSCTRALIGDWQLDDATPLQTIGWVLHFGNDFLAYCNCGDEAILLFNELPMLDPPLKTTIEVVAGNLEA